MAAAAYFTRISRVLLFWIAFVLTRPFGATFGDVLTKPVAKGGIGFGTIGFSAVLLVILVIGVAITLVKLQRQAALVAGLGVNAGVERIGGVTTSASGGTKRAEWTILSQFTTNPNLTSEWHEHA